MPARGELIRHPAGLEFEVLDADPRRVKRVRITRLKERRDKPREPRRRNEPEATPSTLSVPSTPPANDDAAPKERPGSHTGIRNS